MDECVRSSARGGGGGGVGVGGQKYSVVKNQFVFFKSIRQILKYDCLGNRKYLERCIRNYY